MAKRPWTLPALATALVLSTACSSPPPAKPPAPEPVDKWEEPKTNAAPKKCEDLKEKCSATSGTKARIAKAPFTITPVAKWLYAQGENATVAQASDDGPAMVVTAFEIPAPKQEVANRESALDAASKEIGVTLPKKKINWKKPDLPKDVGALKVSIWEVDGAMRKDKKGILLVFSAPLPENKGLIGLGFVPEADPDAEKIGEALQAAIDSIAPGDSAEGK